MCDNSFKNNISTSATPNTICKRNKSGAVKATGMVLTGVTYDIPHLDNNVMDNNIKLYIFIFFMLFIFKILQRY